MIYTIGAIATALILGLVIGHTWGVASGRNELQREIDAYNSQLLWAQYLKRYQGGQHEQEPAEND